LTPPVSAHGSAIKGDQIGVPHFGIWVKGLNSICEELKSQGEIRTTHAGARTKQGTLCTAFVQDPDASLIQLDELVHSTRFKEVGPRFTSRKS
jgi:hypothetical protein